MTQISSYTQYLPPVLWTRDSDPALFLARMLCIFEKILTGIDDGVPVAHGRHTHEALEVTLDRLYRLFDPMQAPAEFLPWLSSWVALALQPEWSEYQWRKLMSDSGPINQRRGVKRGLYTHLGVYSVSGARPRIAIDDGEAVLRATLRPNGTAKLDPVAYSNTVASGTGTTNVKRTRVLLHPAAIGIDANNTYFVADSGDLSQSGRPGGFLWRMSSTGEVSYGPGTEKPEPLPLLGTNSAFPLVGPVAVLIDAQNRVNVVATGSSTSNTTPNAVIYRLTPPNYTVEIIAGPGFATTAEPRPFQAIHPVDAVLDATGRFVVLDRGRQPSGDVPIFTNLAQLVIVTVTAGTGGTTTTTEKRALPTVAEPSALAIAPDGTFIVADARNQVDQNAGRADLLRVDPGAGWSVTSLLGSVPAAKNPLIYPTGLLFESPTSLLVCDTGLRQGFLEERTNRFMAEPAAIYRVDLSVSPPTITPVTDEPTLVYPTGLALDRKGQLIITDRGEFIRGASPATSRNWRASGNEFGVSVHFSQQRQTPADERYRARRGVAKVIDEQRPAQTAWWMDV